MAKKSLTKQLEEALSRNNYLERDRDQYRERLSTAEEKLERDKRERFNAIERAYDREREKSELLFEIVRWLVEPETAKDPFNQSHRGTVGGSTTFRP